MNYYKATRPDGTDFYSGTIDYGAALVSGEVVRHPYQGADREGEGASAYLSISTAPADCTGFRWPCRLFRVEPEGNVAVPEPNMYPNKRAVSALRVVEELPAWQAFGPNGEQVVELLARCRSLTIDDMARLRYSASEAARLAAWRAARVAARNTARVAARNTARVAARDAAELVVWGAAELVARVAAWRAARVAAYVAADDAAWDAARDAAVALVVRDLITPEQFEILYRPWREAIGVPA